MIVHGDEGEKKEGKGGSSEELGVRGCSRGLGFRVRG